MVISDFLDQKLARRFRTFDADGDGFVERDDFETSAGRLADEFGHAADSPARQRIVELSLQLWEHLASSADKDTDNRISLDEYKKAFAAGLLVTPDNFEQGYRPFLEAIMAITDADSDGRFSEDEHVRWTGALMRVPESDARDIFRRLDQDNDGAVTTNEMLTAIHDYYFDDTPDSTGTWLLGPLN